RGVAHCDAALPHVGTESPLYRRDAWQAVGCGHRTAASRGHCRQECPHDPAVDELGDAVKDVVVPPHTLSGILHVPLSSPGWYVATNRGSKCRSRCCRTDIMGPEPRNVMVARKSTVMAMTNGTEPNSRSSNRGSGWRSSITTKATPATPAMVKSVRMYRESQPSRLP